MIRFKVIKASRILLFVALGVLAAVICAIILHYALSGRGSTQSVNASLVQAATVDEAKAISAFALKVNAEDGNHSPDAVEVETVRETSAPEPPRSILIYHTHTHEAYDQMPSDPYEAVEAWRTEDTDHSVVRVGRELAKQLERLGFQVTHDITDHENNALSTAYTRSLKTLEGYDQPFDLYIDLHRDAFSQGMRRAYIAEDGLICAQPMLLIGNGNGFEVKPHYRENYAFAQALTERINQREPGLCKEVLVKDGRYNQHIGIFSVLIEVGHNRNTLEEALNAVPFIASAIRDVFDNPGEPLAKWMPGESESIN